MAGESAAFRSRLQANGAVKPLLHLLLAAQHHPEPRALSAACTAAWALSNMLQDQTAAVSCSTLCFAALQLMLLTSSLRRSDNYASLIAFESFSFLSIANT